MKFSKSGGRWLYEGRRYMVADKHLAMLPWLLIELWWLAARPGEGKA